MTVERHVNLALFTDMAKNGEKERNLQVIPSEQREICRTVLIGYGPGLTNFLPGYKIYMKDAEKNICLPR